MQRAPLAGEEQIAASGAPELDTERGGGPHRALTRGGVPGVARVEDDEWPRPRARGQVTLDHLAGPGDGGPVNPRSRAALSVPPEPVHLGFRWAPRGRFRAERVGAVRAALTVGARRSEADRLHPGQQHELLDPARAELAPPDPERIRHKQPGGGAPPPPGSLQRQLAADRP